VLHAWDADASGVGIESRDWYREAPNEAARRPRPSTGFLVALAALAVAAVALGFHVAGHESRSGIRLGFGVGPTVTVVEAPLYARNDQWTSYLADERTCPGGEDADAPLDRQLETMRCLVDYARARRGLSTLPVSPLLSMAARLKGAEIERCETFAHAPCGGDAGQVARAAGYRGGFGENLYIAEGRSGAARPALDGWLNSSGHRENLFRPEWRVQSLYVAKLPRFREYRSATLWVSHFGDRED
jgi:uncharacterized protein YkwD